MRPASVLIAGTLALVLAVVGMPKGSDAVGTYAPTLAVEHCNGLSSSFPATIGFTDPDLGGNPSCTGANPLATNYESSAQSEEERPRVVEVER